MGASMTKSYVRIAAIACAGILALQVQAALGFPTVIRPSFTLAGSGGGIYNEGTLAVLAVYLVLIGAAWAALARKLEDPRNDEDHDE